MRNPIAIIEPDERPSLGGHPLQFGIILSVHRSLEIAERAYLRAGRTARVVVLNVAARPGERVRIDHLRESVFAVRNP